MGNIWGSQGLPICSSYVAHRFRLQYSVLALFYQRILLTRSPLSLEIVKMSPTSRSRRFVYFPVILIATRHTDCVHTEKLNV